MATTTTTGAVLDRRDKRSPPPYCSTLPQLREMPDGYMLELVTDDFEPFRRDIAAWCDAVGHRLVVCEPVAGGLRFLIEKAPAKPTFASLAVVISSDGLEELLSPLGFALAAALESMTVDIYVQGPGVRVLARGFRPKLHGWQRPFSRFAATGLSRPGHLPAPEKLRQLRSPGARIYVCGPSMQHFKVKPADLIFSDLPVVENFTFMAIMKQADAHIYA